MQTFESKKCTVWKPMRDLDVIFLKLMQCTKAPSSKDIQLCTYDFRLTHYLVVNYYSFNISIKLFG